MKAATCILVAAAAALAIDAGAASVRTLPPVTVTEGEVVGVEAQDATSVRSSNATVFTAAIRESGEAMVSGARLGEARLDYVGDRGVFASRPVMVVPSYWDALNKMFSEDPEVEIAIVGDRIVLSGSTANVETLGRVEQARGFDPARILAQVSYSTAQIGLLVRDFLARSSVTNVGVNVVGREVCLSGRMYDTQSIEQLRRRVEGFVKDFPGITVNIDGLRIYKQKILIGIEFVAYNDSMSRNLGFSGPESITAGIGANVGFDSTRTTTRGWNWSDGTTRKDEGKQNDKRDNEGRTFENSSDITTGRDFSDTSTRGRDRSHTLTGGASARIDGVQATINMLKKNGAAKQIYATTLSTQSGVEAEFQNGGTIYRSTTPGMGSSGDMFTIEYGYIIKATPLIIDENTINLDFSLDNKQQDGGSENDIRLSRYQTKSKYLVRPGESIVLSGYKYNAESEAKKGTPGLSCIPLLGPWLFGNTARDVVMDEMMLVVTVDWALEDEDGAARMEALKDRKVEVEMP